MPTPEPFTEIEREYYTSLKEMVREQLPTGGKLFEDLHAAYERYFKDQGLALSRRERYRLFLLVFEEISAEMEAAKGKLEP